MDCYKDKAVSVLTNFYMGNTKIPYEKRYRKSKQDAVEYLNKMVSESKNETEKKYWEIIRHYTKKIDIWKT